MTPCINDPGDNIWPPPPVPLEGFDVAAINGVTELETSMEMWRLAPRLQELFEPARSAGSPFAGGFQVVAGAAMMVMSPDDPGRIWACRQTNGVFRSPSPEDFRGAQNAVLQKLARALGHPALRAHIADMAWSNDRKLRSAAELAVNSYVDVANYLLQADPACVDRSSLYHVDQVLSRALQINNQTQKRGFRPERLATTFLKAYSETRDRGEPLLFTRLAKLALHYKAVELKTVATDAEAAAMASTVTRNPLVAAEALDLAAYLFDQLGNQEARLRCRLASADCRLAMRKQVSTPGAEAHWVQEAIHSLLGLKGAAEKRHTLRRELRDLQEDSLDEFISFGYPLGLEDQIAQAEKDFEGLDPADGLYRMLACTPIPTDEELRRQALDTLQVDGAMRLFPTGHIDERGRTAAHTKAPDSDGPDEEWIKTTINKYESIRRQLFVQSFLEPARSSLTAGCNIRDAHIRALVSLSPFVPTAQTGLITLGLLRMLQGDFTSATYLLTPQIEPCLRHLLRVCGYDPASEYENLTEEDVSLTAILTRFREQLAVALPPGLILELDILFHHRGGCALRHAVAHGRVSDGGCHSFDVVYASWFIFRLVGLPLIGNWDTVTGPAIRAVDGYRKADAISRDEYRTPCGGASSQE